MRKEHKHHAVIVSFMMLLVLAVFIFVILNRPEGATITTSLPHVEVLENQAQIVNGQDASTNIETDVLIGFLIILALLFIWYLAIKISKELRGHHA